MQVFRKNTIWVRFSFLKLMTFVSQFNIGLTVNCDVDPFRRIANTNLESLSYNEI